MILLQIAEYNQYILPAPVFSETGDELLSAYYDINRCLEEMGSNLIQKAVSARIQRKPIHSVDMTSNTTSTIYAVNKEYFDINHEQLLSGRLITEYDVEKSNRVIILDEKASLAIFRGESPIGEPVLIDGVPFQVVGVIAKKLRIGETDTSVSYIPITFKGDNALQMETLEITTKGIDRIFSPIVIENVLRAWNPSGSFYNCSKMKHTHLLSLRWILVILGLKTVSMVKKAIMCSLHNCLREYKEDLKRHYLEELILDILIQIIKYILAFTFLFVFISCIVLIAFEPLYIFSEWIPENLVDFSSIGNTLRKINDNHAISIKYLSKSVSCIELAGSYLRWGMFVCAMGILVGMHCTNRKTTRQQGVN